MKKISKGDLIRFNPSQSQTGGLDVGLTLWKPDVDLFRREAEYFTKDEIERFVCFVTDTLFQEKNVQRVFVYIPDVGVRYFDVFQYRLNSEVISASSFFDIEVI